MIEKGLWLNANIGYTLTKIVAKSSVSFWDKFLTWLKSFFSPVQYRFALNCDFPLSYISSYGVVYQPFRHGTTDMGSLPSFLAPLPGYARDDYLISCILHDAGYQMHGFYSKSAQDFYRDQRLDDCVFTPMSRNEVDQLLREMVLTEGGSEATASNYYRAVVLFGNGPWNSHPRGPAT